MFQCCSVKTEHGIPKQHLQMAIGTHKQKEGWKTKRIPNGESSKQEIFNVHLMLSKLTAVSYTWNKHDVCAKSLQSCLTLCNPTDCSPPGSSVHGALHAGILEWAATPSSRGSSQPRQRSNPRFLSLLHCRQILYRWASQEARNKHRLF